MFVRELQLCFNWRANIPGEGIGQVKNNNFRSSAQKGRMVVQRIEPVVLWFTGCYRCVLSRRFMEYFDDGKCIWCGNSNSYSCNEAG